MILFLLFLIGLVSLFLTRELMHFSLQRNILDLPNHRSSHTLPTPRGGGMSFIICFLAVLPILYSWHFIRNEEFIACIIAGSIIAWLGFMDDKNSIRANYRLSVHFFASLIILYCFKGMPNILFFNWTFPSAFANISGLIFLVWLINLYNFMDGIDGLASIEAITVCLGGSLLYWITGHHAFIVLPLILSAAVAGFLYWNFPPARVFMGDAGSGFLGIIMGIMSMQSGHIKPQLFWSWLILLGFFIVDATVTLLRRAYVGEKIQEAHRSHAYQHASRRFKSHLSVTITAMIINIVWLFPIAVLVGMEYISGVVGLIVAYFPLIILAIQFDAGKSS